MKSLHIYFVSQRETIRARWEQLLRALPVSSALAHPDYLVRMMDKSLDEIFRNLEDQPKSQLGERPPAATCECGLNPWLNYFKAAEVALLEGLDRAHQALLGGSKQETQRSSTRLIHALGQMARREVEILCTACQLSGGD